MLFPFSKFQMTMVKIILESSYEVLLRNKYFWSAHFWQWKGDPFNFIWNLHGSLFCFFIFSKWKKYYNFPFELHKQVIFKLRAVENAILFFGYLLYVYFHEAFVKNFMEKLSFFNANFKNLFQDVAYYKILGCQTLWY